MNAARLPFENFEHFGEYPAFACEGRDILNTAYLGYTGKLAAVLSAHGVSPGDRVLLMMPNAPEALAVFHAAWMIGAAVVPIAPQLTAREAGYVAIHSDARAAVTIPGRTSAMLAETRIPELLVLGRADTPGARDISAEIDSSTPHDVILDRAPGDMALLLYTSGTTAQPKGVILTHQNVITSSQSCTLLNPNVKRYAFLQLLPLYHVYGILMFHVGLAWGLKSVVVPAFDAVKVLRAIQEHKVGRTAVVPTMLVYLLLAPERRDYDTSSLRMVLSGGGPLPEDLRVRFEKAFGCEVNQGYGLSETMSVGSAYEDGEPYRAGASGRPMPLVEVRIADPDDGRPLPPGRRGEICVHGPTVSPGYWKDPGGTHAAFRDGWHLTGDIGYQDRDGYVYVIERKKDLIIKAGENISPREIEEVIHRHPAVAEAAVIGLPDPMFGETICAVLVLKPGAMATADDIKRHCEQHLMKFKIPSTILFRAGLPKNLAGKVLKRELRQVLFQPATAA